MRWGLAKLDDPGNRVRHELVRTNDDPARFLAGSPPCIRPLAFRSSVGIGVVVIGIGLPDPLHLPGHLQIVPATEIGHFPSSSCRVQHHRRVLGKWRRLRASRLSAAAFGLIGREAEIFRSLFGWAVALLMGLCLLVHLRRCRCWAGWFRDARQNMGDTPRNG